MTSGRRPLGRDLLVATAFAVAATAATFFITPLYVLIFSSTALTRIPFFFQMVFLGSPRGGLEGVVLGVFFEWFFVGLLIVGLFGLLKKTTPSAGE